MFSALINKETLHAGAAVDMLTLPFEACRSNPDDHSDLLIKMLANNQFLPPANEVDNQNWGV